MSKHPFKYRVQKDNRWRIEAYCECCSLTKETALVLPDDEKETKELVKIIVDALNKHYER